MIIDVDVFYVFKDSFLGDTNSCRLLINIPTENILADQIGKEVILCFKNNGNRLLFSRVFDGREEKNEYYLKASTLGKFSSSKISLEPSFSPINISSNMSDSLKYIKGKTFIVQAQVRSTTKKYLEFVYMKLIGTRQEEPICIK